MAIVIMAGGGGLRLWPLSRLDQPKQFLDLGSGKTLLEHTYDRARALTDSRNIYVATTREYEKRIMGLLPEVSQDRIFYEPLRRDTGPAFAAAAAGLQRRGCGEDPTIFMWSDHVFTNEDEFISDLKKVPELVSKYPSTVIIVGHTPTFAETGLGYLEVGDLVEGYKDVYRVKAFKEKPDRLTAEEYLNAGNYFWNMAYVSVRPAFLLEQLREFESGMMEKIDAFDRALEHGDKVKAAKIYGSISSIAIDYALLERASDIIAVTGDYGWSDIGNWATVKEIFGTQGDHMPKGHHVHVDSADNYVYNATNKAVSLIGVRGSIVVVTDDAVLVTHKDSCHKVKDVVKKLEEDEKREYL